MNNFNQLCIALTLSVLVSTATHAHDYAIALSPFQTPKAAKVQAGRMLEFATKLDAGDEVAFVDGYSSKTLGIFKVPLSPAYSSPKARLSVNRPAVSALMTFANKAHLPQGNDEPSVVTALRLPLLLRKIAESRNDTTPLDVLVLGSVWFDDPSEPAFTMRGGRIPSDGHLNSNRSQSPFGVANQTTLLGNVRVHWAYSDVLPSDQHLFHLNRWWTLFVEAQGGSLVSFDDDLNRVLKRVTTKPRAPRHIFKRETSDKLEMIRLRRAEVSQSAVIFARPLSRQKLPVALLTEVSSLQVGITWLNCLDCDLDLYARGSPEADMLYYGHTQSAEGEFSKDYQYSPELTHGQETITFSYPINLHELMLLVNIYSGSSPDGINGEIRMAVAGNTYALPFHIPATRGNQGKDIAAVSNGAQSSAHTLTINPLAILGQGV